MASLEAARKDWAEWAGSRPIDEAMAFSEEGLVLGAGTVLAKASVDRLGRAELSIDGVEERIVALLAIAYGAAVSPSVLGDIRRASDYWSRGQTSLALIQLAYAGLPTLPDSKEASFRLFLADRVLAGGLTPQDLLKACGIDSAPLGFLEAGYNPNQARVPKGNPEGGQWTSEDGETGPAAAEIVLADYKSVKEPPKDAKVVTPPDGVPIAAGDPPTVLIAPPHADFREVYAAGQSIASLPYSEQIHRGYRPPSRWDLRFPTGPCTAGNPAGLCER